jgi:hypothetical protein
MRPCPSCARRIQDAATKCHYCGAVVRAPRTVEQPTSEPAHPRKTRAAERLPLPFRIAFAILAFGAAMAWLVW